MLLFNIIQSLKRLDFCMFISLCEFTLRKESLGRTAKSDKQHNCLNGRRGEAARAVGCGRQVRGGGSGG